MHITVYCPECQSEYRLKPEMRGQLTRCKNPSCRQVFEVREAEGEAPAGSASTLEVPEPPAERLGSQGSSQAGSVGELVPMLPAEEVGESAESAKPAAAAPTAAPWQQPPPVRRRPAQAAPDTRRTPPPGTLRPAPVEPVPPQPAPSWETAPPPVRHAGASPGPPAPASPDAPPEPAGTRETPPAKPPDAGLPPAPVTQQDVPPAPMTGAMIAAARRRRARRIMISLVGLMIATAAVVVVLVLQSWAHSEEERYQAALGEFDQADYAKSADSFQKLAKDFPESPRAKEYRFLEEYSRSLQPAHELGANPHETLQGVLRFLDAHQSSPLLEAHRAPAGAALAKIAEDLAAEAGQALTTPPDPDRARQGLQEARRAQAEARKLGANEAKVAEAIGKVQEGIAQAERRREFLQRLTALQPTPEDIHSGEQMAREVGLAGDPEVESFLSGLKQKVLAKIGYTPASLTLGRRPDPGAPGLVVVTPVRKAAAVQGTGQGVVFAIARGVLYALAAGDGSLLWVTRVGIDCTTLPVRVPVTETTPELALVISAEPPSVSARNLLTGEERWHFHLPAPCLGRPVMVDGRAFIPTVAGRIYDIDVPGDQLRGWYEVGSRLTVGGAHPDGSPLLYFPADSLQVYVLDINQNKCVDILQTGHPAGSLRAEPIVIGPDMGSPAAAGEAVRRGYLILDEADGLGGTRLRAFTLGAGPGAQPAAATELSVRGWSWFPPCCDGEKLALATDAGIFGLFGINQAHNDDPPLFRFLPEDVSLAADATGRPQGRAQVVYAGENDFWLLVRGELSHWHLGLDRTHGLRLAQSAGWKLSEPLGWPLHAGQVDQGRDSLVVVTRALEGSTCLATAVSAQTGRVRWQRRLGTVAGADPLALDGRVLTQDREGALFLFDPGQDSPAKDQEWRSAGRVLAPPVKDAGGGPAFLLPGADGHSAVGIVSAANGTRLEVRWYRDGKVTAKTFTPVQPLAGTPGVGPDYLLLPLADGSLLQQGLDGAMRYGSWRTPQSTGPATAPHVVHLGPEEFLASDGFRMLSRWAWPTNQNPRVEKTRLLPGRIVAAPLILPEGGVCVALAGGKVQLLKADTWQTQWEAQFDRDVTAGPYRLGDFIACVVDHRQLVWFDPADGKSRQFPEQPAAAIVGRPQLVGGVIMLANLHGKITGIDPQTGKASGPADSLPAGVATAGAPVAFGPDRLFVPLSDGTVALVARAQSKK